ncbi:hypothetical protein [Planctomicrobium sp. SH664]|uniref:hypothetical protein n=1 Tax=Planctomicrobium sp. SH664 TaxID=3448125 RepID=UPI003F5BF196
MRFSAFVTATMLGIAGIGSVGEAADMYGMSTGHPDLQQIGPMAMGPAGILFIGDPKGAQIFAVKTGDENGAAKTAKLELEDVAASLAAVLNTDAKSISLLELVVNPETGNAFLGVGIKNRAPRIVKLDGAGNLTELVLDNIPFSRAALPNAAEDKEVQAGNRRRNNRESSITDLAFVEGQVLVSGLSSDKAASNVWSLAFPFSKVDQGTNLEIYHAAHGRSEDYAPIRTFVPFIVDGEPSLLAGFVCTPLVKFPLKQLSSSDSSKVRGTTIAELGNRNQPLDMIAYKKGDQNYLLLANSARGVMKVSAEKISENAGLTEPVPGGGTAGQPFEQITELEGTVQLDSLDDRQAVVVVKKGDELTLKTVPLP